MDSRRIEILKKQAAGCGGCPVRVTGSEMAWLLSCLELGDAMAERLEATGRGDAEAVAKLKEGGIEVTGAMTAIMLANGVAAKQWRMKRAAGAVVGTPAGRLQNFGRRRPGGTHP